MYTMDNDEIVPPHLNAEVYRNNVSGPNISPYLDYIVIDTDGTTLIGCSEMTGRFWNGGAKILQTVNDVENVQNYCKEFISLGSGNPDGCFIKGSNKVLLCEDNGTVSVWARAESCWGQWDVVESASEHDDIAVAVACVDPGKEYITVGYDGNIKIWDISNMICMTNFNAAHSMAITSVAVQEGNQKFVTTSYDKFITFWDKNLQEKVLDIAVLSCGVRCAGWLNEHELIVGDEAGELTMADIRNLKSLTHLTTYPAPVHRITVCPESREVAVCCDNRKLSVGEVSATKSFNFLYQDSSKHTNYIRGMAWDSKERNTLHTVAWDGTLVSHTVRDK